MSFQPDLASEARSRRRVVITAVSLVTAALILGVTALGMTASRYRYYYAASESMLPTLQTGKRFWADRWAFRNSKLPRRGDIVVYSIPSKQLGGADGGHMDLIHRVMALPGDRVQIRAASLMVAGHRLEPIDFGAESLHDLLRQQFDLPPTAFVKITKTGIIADGLVLPLSRMTPLKGVKTQQLRLTPGRVIINGKVLDEPYCAEDVEYDDLGSEPEGFIVSPNNLCLLGDNRNHSADSHVLGQISTKQLVGRANVPNR